MTATDLLADLWTRAADKRSKITLPGDLLVVCDRTREQIVVEFAKQGRQPTMSEVLPCLPALHVPRAATRLSERKNGYAITRYTWPNPDPPQLHLALELAPIIIPPPAAADEDDSLDARFARFHAANPHVYRALVALAMPLVRAGCRRIGVKLLIEKLRYEYALATAGDEFRLNNNYTSRYARLLVADHPELRDIIEQRELRT